jgi:O-antigen/teichoic acid export membrane protein
VSLFAFASLFFGFGLFPAAARIAALAKVDQRASIVGAALLLYIPVGAAFSVVLFAVAWVVGDAFTVEPYHELGFALAGLLGFGYPFQAAGENLARGIDRLQLSAYANVLFQALFVGGLLCLIAIDAFDAGPALVLRSVALGVSAFILAALLKPVFRHVRALAREVLVHTRRYGFQLYLGRLLSIGTYNVDVVLVGIWADSDEVGFYALAVALAGASGLPVIAAANAMFVRMAHAPRIERRWLVSAAGAGGAIALVGTVLASPAVDLVFSDRYADVVPLLAPLLVAQAIRGVTTVYNVFLSAHGRGAELRNAGLVLTVSNLVLIFALIPPFGAMGAAVASLVALTINYGAHVLFYRRSLRGTA